MGSILSRERTLAVSSTPKPEPKAEPTQRIKHERLAQLMFDPRSPSTGIDRTPILVDGPSETSKVTLNGCTLLSEDPRSPSIGITRTPVRDDMRVTAGSFARQLGILFHKEAASVSIAPPGRFSNPSNLNVEEEETTVTGDLGSMEPLLAGQAPQTFGTMAQHANLLTTPVRSPLSTGDMSPFVLLENIQLEVETEADLTLEEAEEARESPLHKRLSMSLITCHEGAASSQILAEVHCNSPSPVATAAVEQLMVAPDHSYTLASFTHDPASPQSPAQLDVPTVSSEQLDEAAAQVSASKTEESDTVPEPQTTPVALEPQITPATQIALELQTTPTPLELQTTSTPLEPQITPTPPELQTTPAALEPQITPAALEPQITQEPPTTPAALEPQTTPAALEPQITQEPPTTPAALEPQTTPAALEPQIAPEAQTNPAIVEAQSTSATLELQTAVPTLKLPAVVAPSPQDQEVQSCKGLRCPNLTTKSPSQVVFKPQWLGKGFGSTGLRARGVQARRRSKGGSSPLAVRVAVKNVFHDNRGQSTKPKQKGNVLGEGRSPLQLKETNSPREQSSQMKLKVSTPDRQRLGQLDRRTLAVSLDKENR